MRRAQVDGDDAVVTNEFDGEVNTIEACLPRPISLAPRSALKRRAQVDDDGNDATIINDGIITDSITAHSRVRVARPSKPSDAPRAGRRRQREDCQQGHRRRRRQRRDCGACPASYNLRSSGLDAFLARRTIRRREVTSPSAPRAKPRSTCDPCPLRPPPPRGGIRNAGRWWGRHRVRLLRRQRGGDGARWRMPGMHRCWPSRQLLLICRGLQNRTRLIRVSPSPFPVPSPTLPVA